MANFQVWLVHFLAHAAPPIAAFMRTKWGWPMAESIHFLGLSMLVGCIGLFDLRLLGMAKRIPIAAMHKLIPWGLFGFAINITTGSLFLLTEPDQYIYNPSFQFKVLFIMLAGANALTFYATSVRPRDGAGCAARCAALRESRRRRLAEPVDWRDRLRKAADVLPTRRLPRLRTGPDRRLHAAITLT